MNKFYLSLLFFCMLFCVAKSQPFTQTTTDTWKGFERVNGTIAGHEAYYVKPIHPLPGHPWVWRASFPDWHPEMDSLLLTKGLYLAYISVDNQYGSPYAMQVWDRFYYYLTDTVSFAPTVALEGVSRGGLYVYAWAKRNPDKVNCIYNEGPVCDFKSWPGAKGKGLGDSTSWKQLLQVYHMTEQQAMTFDDNPIDHVEGLAAFKVPILHLTSLADQYVPAAENTNILVQRYLAAGGPAMIYPVTTGPQELGGHHYPIEHSDWWANFILQHATPINKKLKQDAFIHIGNGLENSFQVFTQNKNATVAFLGGSITYNPGWRNKVCKYLQERFPNTTFHFIAAGIPSLGSLPHAFRLQRDILDSGKVDLLFVEAAVNDRANETDSVTQLLALEGIVRHAKSTNPLMDIVLMSFADPDKNTLYQKGLIPAEVANHELIAAHYGLASINLAKEVSDKIQNGEFSWDYDFKDLHPSVFGQELYFSAIKQLFHSTYDQTFNNHINPALPNALLKGNLNKGNYADIRNTKHDNGWEILQDWVPTDNLATRDGFVHIPMLVSTKPGSALSFPFTGNAVGIAITAGQDAGIVAYSIDNGPVKQLDLFTQWSSMLHLPWYLLLANNLTNGKHILHLKTTATNNPNSKGYACRIAYFLVNQ